MKLTRIIGFAFSLLLLAAPAANAQLFRAYLSSTGSDTNPCTLPLPCRLLPAALTAVASGGEIWMLNSANYNAATVSVTKSVTILALPGEVGSVVGGAAINQKTAISISGAGVVVTLKNLVIKGLNTPDIADIGVLVTNGAAVTIEDCTISSFLGNTGSNGLGIWVSTSSPTLVNVVNTVVRNNAWGMLVEGNAKATVSKSHFLSNGRPGLAVQSTSGTFASVSVSDSVSNGNEIGFLANATTGAGQAATMYVTRSTASHNTGGGGFVTNNNEFALMVVGESMATQNSNGGFVNQGLGQFLSRGNNLTGSAGNSGTITPYAGS